MSTATPTAPGGSPSDVWLRRTNLVGVSLGGIAYGAFVALFIQTFRRMRLKEKKDRRWMYHLTFATVLFAVTTLNVAADARTRWRTVAWIYDRNYPGGPVASDARIKTIEFVLANSAYALNNFLTDGLVLYRCFIIWQGNYAVIFIPLLMFLASTGLSIVMVYQTANPGAKSWTTLTGIDYGSLSISLNILVTILISSRLLFMRRRVRGTLSTQHSRQYISIISMLVESAALYSITGLVFLITFAQHSYAQNIIFPVLCSAMPASPMLILLCIVSGKGFHRDTAATTRTQFTTISFAPGLTATVSRDSFSRGVPDDSDKLRIFDRPEADMDESK